eukprot:4188881-Karenia_brevis.AAC.1
MASENVFWCLGNEVSMWLGVRLITHRISEHEVYYEFPFVGDDVKDMVDNVQKMFTFSHNDFKHVPVWTPPPCSIPNVTSNGKCLKDLGLMFAQEAPCGCMLKHCIQNGEPNDAKLLETLCKHLGIEGNATVQPGHDKLTKASWAWCVIRHVLADEPEDVQTTAFELFHAGAKMRR